MSYRVIISDYKMRNSSYEVIEDTQECVGEGYNYRDAHLTALQNDTRYKLSWVQKLHNGVWYECDPDGNVYHNRPANPQEISFTEDAIEDMKDSPEDYNLNVDQNGKYIIPTKSIPTNPSL